MIKRILVYFEKKHLAHFSCMVCGSLLSFTLLESSLPPLVTAHCEIIMFLWGCYFLLFPKPPLLKEGTVLKAYVGRKPPVPLPFSPSFASTPSVADSFLAVGL